MLTKGWKMEVEASEKQKYSRSAVQCTGAGTSLTRNWKEKRGGRDSGWRFIVFCIGEGQKVEIT